MIADGDPLVVGEQRVVGSEHGADVGGVVDGGVEVGVVADQEGEDVVDLGGGDEGVVAEFFVVSEGLGVFAEEFRDSLAEGGAEARGDIGVAQRVEDASISDVDLEVVGELLVVGLEDPGVDAGGEVDDGVADAGDDGLDPRALVVVVIGIGEPDEAQGEVLDGEVGVVGAVDPAGEFGVVGVVDGVGHGWFLALSVKPLLPRRRRGRWHRAAMTEGVKSRSSSRRARSCGGRFPGRRG